MTHTKQITSSDDWIAYVGTLAFPEGEAGSRRMLGVARSFAAAGHEVVVLAARGNYPLRVLEHATEDKGAIQHVGLGEYDSSWQSCRKLRYILMDNGKGSVSWLDRQQTKPCAVVLYGASLPALLRLKSWCQRNSVPLICDIVEWYSPGQVVGGVLGPVYWSSQFALRYLVGRTSGVIGISKLLCDYYRSRQAPVVRIPPTLDVQQLPATTTVEHTSKRPLYVVYAGIPGKKDLIGNVLEALRRFDPQGKRIRLRMVGPSLADVSRAFGDYPKDAVEVLGRRTHTETLDIVRQSDFSILLRPNRRYAHAGYPTKVVESMSCGTPVICNLTSDLADAVQDQLTGIVCADHSAESCGKALETAVSLLPSQLAAMRLAAREYAERTYDFRNYGEPLREFLDAAGVR